jgi:hydrolase with alpha/beta fold
MNYLKKLLCLLLLLLITACAQESFFLFPKKISQKQVFSFHVPYQEINLAIDKDVILNTVLLKAKKSKGVVLYLHGNGGNVSELEPPASLYLECGYDVWLVDYRGFGKSSGRVRNEQEWYDDMQQVYTYVKKRYVENKIIIVGFSMGTGLAAKLAANNHPKALILLAPYYSLVDLAHYLYPFVPSALLKYKIPTHVYLRKVRCPIYLVHGAKDILIRPRASIRLKKELPRKIRLYLLTEENHHTLETSSGYHHILNKILKTNKLP